MDTTIVTAHSIDIKAPENVVLESLGHWDFQDSWKIGLLLRLRGFRQSQRRGFQTLTAAGFISLEPEDGQILLFGLAGQFWKPAGNIQKLTPEEFHDFSDPEFAKVLWSFSVTPVASSQSKLETETRVYCFSKKIEKKFKRYWFIVGPFSGLIRKEMLRIVRTRAEATFNQEKQLK